MKPFRILICGSTFGGFGGIEAFMLALAQYLNGRKERWHIRVLFKLEGCHQPDGRLEKLVTDSRVSASFYQKGDLRIFKEIWRCDLVHVQNTSPELVIPARLMDKPVLSTQYNWRRNSWHPRYLIWRICETLVHKRFYISTFVQRSWTEQPETRNRKMIPVVSNLKMNFVPFEPRKGFLFMGRWIPNKGLRTLIHAYATANIDRTVWPLILMGDGPLRDDVESLCDKYQLTTVKIPGFVDERRKQAILSSAKWIVAPANTLEDMGLTPIEGRSCGIPSIVSNDGGLPEAGGPAALICEPGSIDSLQVCLEKAASMSEEKYRNRSRQAFSSLTSYLKPLSFYEREYRELLND